jgi:hypothetical protein
MIPGLTIAEILDFATKSKPLEKFVPALNEWVHVDRKWLCDLLYTCDTDAFQAMIDAARAKNKKEVAVKANTLVGIRAEFAAALNRSVVCSNEGKSFRTAVAAAVVAEVDRRIIECGSV